MLRTTAQDCWSAGIGGSGEWRGPPATGEARETVDYRPFIGPLSTGDPATSRRPLAARAGDTGLSPPAWSHRVAKQWASASTAQYSKLSNVTSPEGVVARIVTGPHDAQRQNPHRPMRYDTGRPRAVIRFRISQPRTASLPCPAGLRARRPSPMIGATGAPVESPGSPTPWMPRPLRGRSWRANRPPSRRPRTGRSR